MWVMSKSPICSASIAAGISAMLYGSSQAVAFSFDTLTLDCKLHAVSVLTDDNGQITQRAGTNRPEEMTLTFSGFNEKTSQAVIVGNQGSSPVLFYDVFGHLQIIEFTEAKNVSTTSVFISEQRIYAVHTRHMADNQGGVFSVFEGPCLMR